MQVLFDKEEEDILEQIVALEAQMPDCSELSNITFGSHAEGVIEVTTSIELRIASALYALVGSTVGCGVQGRIKALERLYRDVSAVEKGLRLNAARVLVEIMKEVMASPNDHKRRLELIRDFRETYTGKPRIVRRQLAIYQLLEIPEDESQLSFDDNVDNASKVGKKNPALLILDAWIKGVRKLQVVTSNYIKPVVAHELLAAADILGVEVEIGIELPLYYNNKFIKFVWTPLGVGGANSFLKFLSSSAVEKVFQCSREVEVYHHGLIISLLERFNSEVKSRVEKEYGVKFGTLDAKHYREFLEQTNPSEVNLSEFVYSSITEAKYTGNKEASHKELIPEIILLRYLKPLSLESSLDVEAAQKLGSVAPDVKGLVKLVNNTTGGFRLTLFTSNLHSWEIPDILYQSKGGIDAIEIFNLRDYTLAYEGVIKYGDGRINEFRKAVNEGRVSHIKRMLSEDIVEVSRSTFNYKDSMIERLVRVRKNIGKLLDRYSAEHIEPAIGSGAAGRGTVFYGMGLVVKQSLGERGASVLEGASADEHLALPLGCQVYKRVEYISGGSGIKNYWQQFIEWHNRKTVWGQQRVREVADNQLEGNIYTLSGRFGEERFKARSSWLGHLWEYLNTDMKNWIKVLIGFLPAFFTFYLTAEWDVLRYGGGIIWFAITGGRNIFQAVLAAGGFDRTLNIRWRTLVDKKRIAESLMYTGLSVPLLEYVVKDLLLNNALEIDAGGNPLIVFAVMSGINGVYVSMHNFIRGFSRAAIVGNFFRSAIAIPVALVLSSTLFKGLSLVGVVGVAGIVSQWSAVISKTASDIIACIIEGFADREAFVHLRRRGIKELELKFFYLCERIELLAPNKLLLEVLGDNTELTKLAQKKNSEVADELVLWLLDLMYFWYNKPRARVVLKKELLKVNSEDKELYRTAVLLLENNKLVGDTLKRISIDNDTSMVYMFYLGMYKKFIKSFGKIVS